MRVDAMRLGTSERLSRASKAKHSSALQHCQPPAGHQRQHKCGQTSTGDEQQLTGHHTQHKGTRQQGVSAEASTREARAYARGEHFAAGGGREVGRVDHLAVRHLRQLRRVRGARFAPCTHPLMVKAEPLVTELAAAAP